MKNKKMVIGLFVISLVLGTASVLADSPYQVFTNIKIPALKNAYTSSARTKTEQGNQSVKNIGSTHAVVVSTIDSNNRESGWLPLLSDAGFTSWKDTEKNGNSENGIYNLRIKHSNNILSGKFTGTWALNPSYAKN